MGYRVVYGSVKKVRRLEGLISGKVSLTALWFLLFCILVCSFWPEGKAMLQKLVFPGDPAVTAAAFEELTVDLKAGVNLAESLKRFCISILAIA